MIRGIKEYFDDYCKALDWAISFSGKNPTTCRFHKYKEMLKEQLDEYEAGIKRVVSDREGLRAAFESNLEGSALIEIHQTFGNRREKELKDNIGRMLMGPIYSANETFDGTKMQNTYARDIQSELILASKYKKPEAVTLKGNDIVYDLGDIHFGIECKRTNSNPRRIELNFKKACEQIQDNPDISGGLVALRIDKSYFVPGFNGEIFTGPQLVDARDLLLVLPSKEDSDANDRYQTSVFWDRFSPALTRISKKYPKVAGVCLFVYQPYLLKNIGRVISSGYAVFWSWESKFDPTRLALVQRFQKDLHFEGGYTENQLLGIE